MNKKLLMLTAILAVSGATYAAPTTKLKTEAKTIVAKVETIKEVVKEVEVKEPELKLEKGKMVSQITGTVVFESEIFDSVKKSGVKTDTVIGDIDTNGEDETLLGEKMPKGSIELGAKVFENYEVKLKLNATKSIGEDVSTLSVSRTWADSYAEWKSEINLNEENLYQSLVPNSQIILRKSKGRVEGQVKAGVKSYINELTGASESNYGVDTKSQDTYIKIKVNPTTNVTLRPYDMDFTIGKRFENNNFDRTYAQLSDGDLTITTKEADDRFKNIVGAGDKRVSVSGIEFDKTLTNMKVYGKLNMFNLTDCLYSQVGMDYKGANSKVTIAGLIGLGINNFSTVSVSSDSNLGQQDGLESNISENVEKNYFGLNARAEMSGATTLFEVEGDLRSQRIENDTTKYNGNDFMFGLYGKATFNKTSELRPYVYSEFVNKSVNVEKEAYKYEKPYNSFSLGGGAEKTIDNLVLTGDLSFIDAKEGDSKSNGVSGNDKEDYGNRFLASFKAVYRF